MEENKLIFYAEWLRLPKEQFRILVMLAEVGAFRGSLTDMCGYFSVDSQTSNRNRFRTAVKELSKQGYITTVRKKRTYRLSIVPKETEITMPADWVARIRRHEYNTEGVAWEIVLKVLLWLLENASCIGFTNAELAYGVNSSVSQVCAAKNVLEKEYEAFIKKHLYYKNFKGEIRCCGQIADMSAWWKAD